MTCRQILIVEDDEMSRKLLRDLLHVNGYETLEVESAEEGIELARETLPSLIVMDIRLPGMDGVEAFRILRGENRTSHIPIIAVTASAMTEDLSRIRQEGFDAIQSKPIDVNVFARTVASIMSDS